MILTLVCSFAGSIQHISCIASFSVDWLRGELSRLFSIKKSVLAIQINGRVASDDAVEEYVDAEQTTAVVAVTIDFNTSRTIRCLVRYGSLLREVDADPKTSILSLVKSTFVTSPFATRVYSSSLRTMVDGKEVDPSTVLRECAHFGSTITITEEGSRLEKEKACSAYKDARVLSLRLSNGYSFSFPLPASPAKDLFNDVLNYCNKVIGVAVSFIHLVNEFGEEITPSSFCDAIAVPNPVLFITVQLRIRDSLGKTHDFSPVFSDTIQSLITVIQNCPFVRLPMKIQFDGRDISPSMYVWNLLQTDIDMTKLRASERTEDIECMLLKDEFNTQFTLAGTLYSVHIPQDGLVYVSLIPSKGSDSIVVEYGEYNGLIVPRSLCRAIPEDDEVVYDTPVEKRVCMDWESNCPYQLSVKANDVIRVFKENEDYFYGSIIIADDSRPSKEGWVQKSLFM